MNAAWVLGPWPHCNFPRANKLLFGLAKILCCGFGVEPAGPAKRPRIEALLLFLAFRGLRAVSVRPLREWACAKLVRIARPCTASHGIVYAQPRAAVRGNVFGRLFFEAVHELIIARITDCSTTDCGAYVSLGLTRRNDPREQ